MNINWILRLKNKETLTTLAVGTITFVYLVLGCFNIVAPVAQDQVTQIVMTFINLLCLSGIVIDPTTAGISDSKEALEYTEPKKN